MVIELYYVDSKSSNKFQNTLQIPEYYISNSKEELKVFIKGCKLCITHNEYKNLVNKNFDICTNDGVVLFNNSEISLSSTEILF